MSADYVARGLALAARPAPYKGLVATRLNIPSLINSAYRQVAFRRWHIARDAVASIQIAFPNWIANNVALEAGSGGTAIFRAAIERLDGTIQPFTWGGTATSPVVADGGQTPLSDSLPLATPLKSGEWFAIRGYGEFSAGIILNSLADSALGSAGDAVEYAQSGLADKTVSGTISATPTSVSFGPCLIVGDTRRASALLIGDSRVKGGASAPGIDTGDAAGDLGELARSIGPRMAYVNCGTASERLDQFLTANARRLALATYASHIVANYAINDLLGNRTAASILADIATLAESPSLKGKPIAWTTIGPRTSSSDDWTSVANQTPFAQDGERRTLNAALRARRVAGLADVFDTAAAYESAIDSGRFVVGEGGEKVTSDGLHLLASGTRRIQRSGLVDAGRLTRPT
ncbi:MAG: hypothetical protein OSB00_05950 [Sphingomonas bacterium]|nr:hypothetical protein [Sphingomonas bacterium]